MVEPIKLLLMGDLTVFLPQLISQNRKVSRGTKKPIIAPFQTPKQPMFSFENVTKHIFVPILQLVSKSGYIPFPRVRRDPGGANLGLKVNEINPGAQKFEVIPRTRGTAPTNPQPKATMVQRWHREMSTRTLGVFNSLAIPGCIKFGPVAPWHPHASGKRGAIITQVQEMIGVNTRRKRIPGSRINRTTTILFPVKQHLVKVTCKAPQTWNGGMKGNQLLPNLDPLVGTWASIHNRKNQASGVSALICKWI